MARIQKGNGNKKLNTFESASQRPLVRDTRRTTLFISYHTHTCTVHIGLYRTKCQMSDRLQNKTQTQTPHARTHSTTSVVVKTQIRMSRARTQNHVTEEFKRRIVKGSQINRDNIGLQVYQHRTAMPIARESPERKSGERPPRENTHMVSPHPIPCENRYQHLESCRRNFQEKVNAWLDKQLRNVRHSGSCPQAHTANL